MFEEGGRIDSTTEVQGNQLWIRWSHLSPTPEEANRSVSGSRTFVLNYRVKGAIQIHEEIDRLVWKAVFKDRPAAVGSTIATISSAIIACRPAG